MGFEGGRSMTKDNHILGKFELTGEVDANGILNVAAEDKGAGKSEKITITQEKGRLSQEDIDRMVQEAEEFAEDDKKVKERIDARNALEGYSYSIRNTIEDEKLKDKIEEADRETIQEALKETTDWLDDNQNADKEDFEAQQKSLEEKCKPIMSKFYSGGMPPQDGEDGGAGGDEDEEGDHDEL